MPLFLIELLKNAFSTFLEMSPYLLFGFAIAGVLAIAIPAQKVEEHLGGSGIVPILKASLFGVPLPLCSCSVIPVSVSLRKHGASRAATTSFLLSTPQTGVDSIMVTLSLLGPLFAIVRPIAALISGLMGGFLVHIFVGKESPTKKEEAHRCSGVCCESAPKKKKFLYIFKYGFDVLPRDIGKPLMIGILIAAVLGSLVPDDFFVGILGGGFGQMFVMMLAGIPMYVCATASVPIAAALMLKGISPGAALVFLMTGPATNAATITTVWKTMGGKTAVIYIGSVVVTSLLSGMALDYIFRVSKSVATGSSMWMLPMSIKYACAAILMTVLLRAIFKK